MSCNEGPHSSFSWGLTFFILLIVGCFVPEFMGLFVGIMVTVFISFVIYKAIGGSGGFFH